MGFEVLGFAFEHFLGVGASRTGGRNEFLEVAHDAGLLAVAQGSSLLPRK